MQVFAQPDFISALKALELLLGITVLRLVVTIIRAIYAYFIRPANSPKANGAWAVVTGGSEGIGKAYAELLAAKGKPRNAHFVCSLTFPTKHDTHPVQA